MSPTADTHPFYEFGAFRLDAKRGLLVALPAGTAVHLTPKALAILVHLVERAGEVVDKRELIAAVWPNVVVEESNLTQTIHVLRQVLGEQPNDHRYIVTIPGRGYRFVADVRRVVEGAIPAPTAGVVAPEANEVPPPHAAPAARPTWPIVAVAGAALVIAALVFVLNRERGTDQAAPEAATPAEARAAASIAVLPFEDLSAGQDVAYFGDGLAEEILNLLAQSRELRVIARTSSFSLRGEKVDIPTIARRLDVGHVLEGSVRRSGDAVRVTAQLVRGSDGSHLWSQTYDRKLDDLFVVQSEIANAVAGELQATLSARRIADASPPPGPAAYDHYLRGRYFFDRRQAGDLERARTAFDTAVAIAPDFARAWAGVAAVANVQIGDGVVPYETGMTRLHDAAQRAIALDPNLPEAHIRLANYYFATGDATRMRAEFDRAAALDPDHPLVLGVLATVAVENGRIDEAAGIVGRIAAIDPLSVIVARNHGVFLFYAGRLDEARVELQRAQDLAPYPDIAGTIGQVLVLQRDYAGAIAYAQQHSEGAYRDHVLALAYFALGRRAEADAALERLIAAAESDNPALVAEVFAFRGETEEALRWLERATRVIDPRIRLLPGARFLWEIRTSPWLVPLHGDARWAPLVAPWPASEKLAAGSAAGDESSDVGNQVRRDD